MKKIIVLLGIMICGSTYAQSNSARVKVFDIPCEIYDDDKYVTGMGVSRPVQFLDSAIMQATTNAITLIGFKTKSSFKGVIKTYLDMIDSTTVGAIHHYESAGEALYDATLEDIQVVCQKVIRDEEKNYVVYVAARMPKPKKVEILEFDEENFVKKLKNFSEKTTKKTNK